MIRAREVIDHYQDLVAHERSQVGRSTVLYESGIGLPFLEAELHSPVHFASRTEPLTMPRPSQQLVRVGFSALVTNTEIVTDNQKDSIGHFIDTFALHLAGTPVTTEPSVSLRANGIISGTCPDAEGHFMNAAKQIKTLSQMKGRAPSPNNPNGNRLRVYIDTGGTPLILRKQRAVATGMLLQNVRLDDTVNVPAGTIVSIGDTPVPYDSIRVRTYPKDRVIEAIQVGDDFAIRPLRLSPWAYAEQLDRAVFGITPAQNDHRPRLDKSRARQVASYTIDDFRAAAETIVQLCAQ